MSVTAYEQNILTFTGGSYLPHERQRECKKESVRMSIWPSPSWDGVSEFPKKFADARSSQYWPERPVQDRIQNEFIILLHLQKWVCPHHPNPCADGVSEANTGALSPMSQTLSLGQCGHPWAFPCTCSSPFFTKTFGVMQGLNSSLFPGLPQDHNSS